MLVHDFFNNEFKAFSQYDNVRSIPSIVDGLKDSQRKAVYGMTISGNKEIKVSQLAELTSMKTHYDHGGASLEGTIVGLAQKFAGANNVNIFEPIGQFGSILGPEAGASRYIFTKPSRYLRRLFREQDECTLSRKEIDGELVEPVVYYPTLPIWALNGSNGIGTGYRSLILPRRLESIVEAAVAIAAGGKVKPELLVPYFNDWNGVVEEDGDRWKISGVIERGNTTTFTITEIPAGMGIDKVKAALIDLMDSGDVKDFTNYSSETGIKIEVSATRKFLQMADEDILKKLKLVAYVTEHFTFWDEHNNIVVHDCFEDALQHFIRLKLVAVEDVKAMTIQIKNEEKRYLEHLAMFIEQWHTLTNVNKMKTEDIVNHMIDAGVDNEYMSKLLSIKISSLTSDNIKKHRENIEAIEEEISVIEQTDSVTMYDDALTELSR